MSNEEEKRSGLEKMNFNRIFVIIIALFMITSFNAGLIGGLDPDIEDSIMADADPGPVPANDQGGAVIGLEDVWYPENNGLGTYLVGTNQIIGLTGSDVDVNHPDLQAGVGTRVTQLGSSTNYWATLYAGTMIGNGFCYETVEGLSTVDRYYNGYAGVCPEASLIADAGLDIAEWGTMVSGGARVIMNPWGGMPIHYGTTAMDTDDFMNTNPTTMIMFPTGQSGPAARSIYGEGTDWCGLQIGASENQRPEMGSASDDANTLWEGSGRGPQTNGRIKPDIVAPSTHVISTKSTDDPTSYYDVPGYNYYNVATSDYSSLEMSSAKMSFVAGSYALIRQYLMDIEGRPDPNSVLVKAILLNGCDDMGYGYPSYQAGWGRLNVKNSILPDAPRVNQWAESTGLTTGQTWDFTIDGGANTYIESDEAPLKIMLTWMMPASPFMNNNYELEVMSPSGVVYKGNCFDQSGDNDDWSHPDPDAAFWNTLGSPTSAPYGFDYDIDGDNDDDINNVEAVFVEKPEVGQWTVVVRSNNTPATPNFAVAWGADTGPLNSYKVELATEQATTMKCSPGGTLAFPFEILNFGTSPDNIQFTDDSSADLAISYSEASPLALDSNESSDIIAQITASPTIPAGSHEFTITAESLDDPGIPPSQDHIDVKIDIIDSRLPLTYKITDNSMSQAGPSVVAFTNATGADWTLIAYGSEEGIVNGNRVFVSSTNDDLTTGPGTWTHTQVSTEADGPDDIRISHMPSGAYQDRVFISWRGWNPADLTDYGGNWAYCAWADPPYTSWNPVQVYDQTDNPAYDDVWRMTMTACRGSADEVMMIVESLEYLSGSLDGVDTFGKVSTNGGLTWSAIQQISPGDGSYYFYPNAFTDHNDNIIINYYWRTPTGTDRDLCYNYYDGSLSPKYTILDTTDNCQFPSGTSTLEGPGDTNRLYCFFTRGATSISPKDGYIMWADADVGSYPTLEAHWNGPFTIHMDVAGSTISDSDSPNRPILDVDATQDSGNWFVWPQYLEMQEDYNPYGSFNVHNAVSPDGDFGFFKELMPITADSFPKNHQSGDSRGKWMYQTYQSYNGDLETGNMEVWLSLYYFVGWGTDHDLIGPRTSMVSATPNPVGQGWPIEIVANINDISTGFSHISGAEWCEGETPAGPWHPMTALDGSFDYQTEAVIATGNTVGWALGEHKIWVRGSDFGFDMIPGNLDDNWGEPVYGTIMVKDMGPAPPFAIDLDGAVAGDWVFVSFPTTVTGNTTTIFDDLAWGDGNTQWDMIKWYNATDEADHWKTYDINYPGIQDMPDVDNTMGFWIHITDNQLAGDDKLSIEWGPEPSGTTIILQVGWNMVGFPSGFEGYTAGDLKTDSVDLVTRIERYNDASAYDIEVMPDGDAFLRGDAYWIYATAVYPWIIP